jgi:hypothetical protein
VTTPPAIRLSVGKKRGKMPPMAPLRLIVVVVMVNLLSSDCGS